MPDESPLHTEALEAINRKILAPGEDLPAVTLKDGSRVQTGTVATMLHNLREYDRSVRDGEDRKDLERELELCVPTLFRIGLFDLFAPEEWAAGASPGRRWIGEAARRYRP